MSSQNVENTVEGTPDERNIISDIVDKLPDKDEIVDKITENVLPALADSAEKVVATVYEATDNKVSGCCGVTTTDLREQLKALRSYPIFRYFAWFNHRDEKVAVIFANSYFYSKSLALGDSVINDGLLTYNKLTELGYRVFVYYDCLAFSFRRLIKSFMKCHAKTLLIYFSGHGTQIPDVLDKDEEDGKDEALVFYDGWVSDDYIGDCIAVRNVDKLIMIADCCHSGTMFDVKDRDTEIVTMSACADYEEAQQDTDISVDGNGVFTYYLWKNFPSAQTYADLQDKINQDLQKYNHQCIIDARVSNQDELL